MRTKIEDFRKGLNLCDYSVVILLETWLTDSFSNSEISVPGYNIFRTDRSGATSQKMRGGGVLIAVSSNLKSVKVNLCNDVIEQTFVEVKVGKKSYIVGGVYIPPNSAIEKYEQHSLSVLDARDRYPSSSFLVFGDFNLPNARWILDEDGFSVECHEDYPARNLAEVYTYMNMPQVIAIPNNRLVYLDLLFSNVPNLSVIPAVDFILPNSVHHIAYAFDVPMNVNTLSFDEFYFDFKNANYMAINEYLASVDWDECFRSVNVSVAAERLYSIIGDCLTMFVPRKRIKKSPFPRWFSAALKNLICMKKIAHKRYMSSKTHQDYLIFSNYRAQCKQEHEICHLQHLQEIERSLLVNTRNFWRFVGEKRSTNSFPNSMFLGNESAETGQDIVNLFAKFFSTVYDGSICTIPDLQLQQSCDISLNKFSLSEVFKKISELPNTSSCGPDSIPNIFLKNCVCTLSVPLQMIFNLSLDTSTFPSIWKHSFVRPIFKSGNTNDISNYRGVSNQNAVAKLFDSLVYEQLAWKCKGMIAECQFGFSAGRSTADNLVLYKIDLLEAFERKVQVDSVYTDFSKAFDRVSFQLLLAKLEAMGFHPSLLAWLKSFLEGRTQSVKINNFISTPIPVLSGVPQGSHCAPLLFNLFVNDVSKIIKNSTVSMFADDLKIYRTIERWEDSVALQRDLDALCDWARINNLTLNVGKCCYISFFRGGERFNTRYSIGNENLNYSAVIKDLGVWFDEKLSFAEHVARISLKGLNILGFVTRNCRGLSLSVAKLLYISLVRSNMEYATVVWSPFYQTHKDTLERVQNRFLRYAGLRLNIPFVDYHRSVVLMMMGLETLERRRGYFDVCYVYKVIHGLIDSPPLLSRIGLSVPTRTLRNSNLFFIPFHSTNYGQHSPIDRTLRVLNGLNVDIFGCTLSGLKRRLRSIP